jgi:RNA polymerase sigma-70 factor (ECF subfamily)
MSRPFNPLSSSQYGRLLEGLLPQAAGYALSIVRNHADAEDAVQQACLRGLERLASYDPRLPFTGWWFTVLRHCCIDLLRARRTQLGLDHSRVACSPPRDPADWEDLADGLERIEASHAEILRLRYFGNLTYEELAQALAIPKGTVMSRLHYARKALASQMKGSEP